VYEWREHTAEIELYVRAATAREVFAEAADAFGRLIELATDGERIERHVVAEGRDYASLLAGFLDELIYLADTDSFVPDAAEVVVGDASCSAVLTGRVTEIQPIVKAATYHELEFRKDQGAWHARVVLDV
jgi:SHS2 domain-containing protein